MAPPAPRRTARPSPPARPPLTADIVAP
jgi:hypothetical protein